MKKTFVFFVALILFVGIVAVLFIITNQHNLPYPGVESYTVHTMAVSKRKPLEGHQSIRPDFGPVINDITFYRYRPSQMSYCQKNQKNGKSVVVLVNSAPGNFERRKIARQTWISQLRMEPSRRYSRTAINLAGFMFVLGQSNDPSVQNRIEDESNMYGDILQIEMIDTYYNLTVKGVGLINWLNSQCSHVDFVFKVDDDVYVNVNNLAIAVKSADATASVLYGHVLNQPPERGCNETVPL